MVSFLNQVSAFIGAGTIRRCKKTKTSQTPRSCHFDANFFWNDWGTCNSNALSWRCEVERLQGGELCGFKVSVVVFAMLRCDYNKSCTCFLEHIFRCSCAVWQTSFCFVYRRPCRQIAYTCMYWHSDRLRKFARRTVRFSSVLSMWLLRWIRLPRMCVLRRATDLLICSIVGTFQTSAGDLRQDVGKEIFRRYFVRPLGDEITSTKKSVPIQGVSSLCLRV